MSPTCNTAGDRERGAVLATALIGLLLISIILTAAFALASAESARNLVMKNAFARYRIVYAAKLMFQQAIFDGIQAGGNFSQVASKATTATAALQDGTWTATLTNITEPAFTLGDRAAAFGATDGSLMQVSGQVSRARTSYFTANVQLSGSPNGSTGVNLNTLITVAVVEIPATMFQFIVSDQAFAQSANTLFTISGLALFNRGVSPQTPAALQFNGAATSYGMYFGSSNIPSPTNGAYAYAPVGNTFGFTRAIGGAANLIVSPGSPVSPPMISNQALSLAPTNYYHLSWTDPTTAPTGLPPGITFRNILGSNRIVIDLGAYYGYQNVHVDCGPPTQANGIVILGSPAGGTFNATPLCITTTGALLLLGNNARPVITGTSYSLALGASTSSPASPATGPVTWTGYVCLSFANPTITAPCSWGSHSFTIAGTFAFPGGTLNNSQVPMTVQPSASTALALASGNVIPDRLFFCEIR